MEHRKLLGSGLRVPVITFGTATFGGGNQFFRAWGTTDVAEARRLVDICLDAGANHLDTANSYSNGLAEEIVGAAIAGRRDQVLVSTKVTTPIGDGPNDGGSSRWHLIQSCEASLRRLGTDYLDVYYIHEQDLTTPVEETLGALDDLVRSGKVRYIACSNFSGWHLMKSLALSERHGWSRYVIHQAFYSLVSRELEWELVPLGIDQRVSTFAWSPLAGGALTGKVRRGQPLPTDSRLAKVDYGLPAPAERIYQIVDVLDQLATETGRSLSQLVLAWTLQRPTVASVVIGARTEAQLRDNLGAVDCPLTPEQMARLDAASDVPLIAPYAHQRLYPGFDPSLARR